MFGLYLLDVYVARLKLNKEVYIDTGGSTLVAKVVFRNFPPTEVVERERSVSDEKIYVYEFKGGQCLHFSMRSEELVKSMKRVPVKIGVFRVDDNFPICHVHTFLSGCACDLGSVCVENPVPFLFRGPFDLLDPGKSFAGQLELEIAITNLGRRMVTAFALAPNCFVFKNHPDGSEYKCDTRESKRSTIASFGDTSFGIGSHTMDKLLDTSPAGNLMSEIAGISPTAERLAIGSPPAIAPRPPLINPGTLSKKKDKKEKKGKKK